MLCNVTLAEGLEPPAGVVTSPDNTLPRQPTEPVRRPLDEPLISIVIPCYNHAGYLGGAIESALSQTYQNREVIVVDDGSRDAPGDVTARYPGVMCIHQSHQGLGAARNAGIEASKGELLVFLDADDRLLPKALESGLECLRAHPDCGFVFGAHRTIVAGADRPSPCTSPRFIETCTSAFCLRIAWPCTGPFSSGARQFWRSTSTIGG